MGWNVAGFAINRNYKDNMDELAKALYISGRVKLVQGKNKYTFAKSANSGSTKGRMDFYFTEQGSFAFINGTEVRGIPGKTNLKLLEGTEMLVFAASETAMGFELKYYKDGNLIRDFFHFENRMVTSKGEELEEEKTEKDFAYLFFDLVGKLIGKSFWSIGSEEEFVRYLKK